MSDYIFLTGATGLLGRYLLRDLLVAGRRVAVLARPSKKETARERIEGILQYWEAELGQRLSRPICLEGDVCQAGFGLNEEALIWVSRHCSSLLHSAAALTFHADGSGEPARTNVGGTQNMLAFCHDTGIRELHYVSTAYVCGLRSELIMEEDLDQGQQFRNDYEQTKCQAEKLVRQANFIDNLTVYRPAVIAGDSTTGFTNTYHGLYLYLRVMSLLVPQQALDAQGRRHTPLRLPMTGEEQRNVIPIDWVSAVISHLVQTPEAHGRTYHLSPEKCLTPREIIDAGYSYFNSTGVEYVGNQYVDPKTYSRFEAELLPSITMYDNYEFTDPMFDRTNLQRFAGHLPCPVIDEPMLHRYMRYGEEDRWGKRRQPKPQIPAVVYQRLAQLAATAEEAEPIDNSQDTLPIGLDVSGPGGGQWTLLFQEGRLVDVEDGLAADCALELKLDSPRFEQFLRAESTMSWEEVSALLQLEQYNGSGKLVAAIANVLFPALLLRGESDLELPAIARTSLEPV